MYSCLVVFVNLLKYIDFYIIFGCFDDGAKDIFY